MSESALRFEGVTKSFAIAPGREHVALRGIDLEVRAGSKVAITGRSGSGKSTLLHLAAGIDTPSAGEVRLFGEPLARLSDAQRTLLRRRTVGLVFQFFHLLGHLSVRENVLLPAWIAGDGGREPGRRADELLERVGLADRAAQTVAKLSGGEMQRVALCRALLPAPRLLLADEPTGNLDDDNGRRVMELLLQLVDEEGATLVFVTHSAELAALADTRHHLHSGVLETP